MCTEKRRAAEKEEAKASAAYAEASVGQQVEGGGEPIAEVATAVYSGGSNTPGGQQELLDEYHAGGDAMSARQTLRLMAEDAKYGLQRFF